DHLAVPLDVPDRGGVRQALQAVAWLVAAGVTVDARALERRLAAAVPASRPTGASLTLAAHPESPRLPSFDGAPQVMDRAPSLASAWHPPASHTPKSPAKQPVAMTAGSRADPPGVPLRASQSAGLATATTSATAVAAIA